MTERKVQLIELLEEEDTHSTLMRICESYDKAKAYIEKQYDSYRAYHGITEMKMYRSDYCDRFTWCADGKEVSYFISCEPVL